MTEKITYFILKIKINYIKQYLSYIMHVITVKEYIIKILLKTNIFFYCSNNYLLLIINNLIFVLTKG